MKKVLLVAINSKYIHSNVAVRYLKRYTEDLNCEEKIVEFSINDRFEYIAEKVIKENADIIGFSSYIWNIDYVLKVSSLVKLVKPETVIVYGGPEVSFDAPSFLKIAAGDYVIEGEGEETYKEFLSCEIEGKNVLDIHKKTEGLYSKIKGEIYYGGKRPLMDLNKVVFPYEPNEDLKNKIVYYEASRGCPFNCKYCLSSTEHGVRFLDIERVKKDLQYFIDQEVALVKFVDRTFNCNKKFANDIWSYLIENSRKTRFHFEISADILSKESIEVLKQAPVDLFQFEIGVQTTNIEVLKNINRNVTFDHIKEKVNELKELNNIKQHLDLIAGLPGEDYKSFKKSFNEVYTIKPDELQLGFLKLLKGSSMRDEAEKWGMVYSPYHPYEILSTKDISYEELNKLRRIEALVDKYLNSGKFSNILNFFIDRHYEKDPFDFYSDLAEFYNSKGYFDRNISSTEYYKVFVDFAEEKYREDLEPIIDIVKFEFLLFNKKQWIPEFLSYEGGIDKSKEREIKERLIEEGSIKGGNEVTVYNFRYDIEEFVTTGNIELNKFKQIAFFNKYMNKCIFC